MIETHQSQPESKPKPEDFKNQIEFDLARINYWYNTKEHNHPMYKMVKAMEANLRCKLGMIVSD